jgi:hypothetical protein
MKIEKFFVYKSKTKTVKFDDEKAFNLFVLIQLHRGILNYSIQIIEEVKFNEIVHCADHIQEIVGKQNS